MDNTLSERVTVLCEVARGGRHSARELLPLVYEQLTELARCRMAAERRGHALEARELVHEAYLRLAGHGDDPWSGRAHFFAAAAEAMRRVLIDQARTRDAQRHGGHNCRAEIDLVDLAVRERSEEELALNEAVSRLEGASPKLAAVVRLRFYAGLSVGDAAAVLGLATRTVERRWAGARVWLYRELGCASR